MTSHAHVDSAAAAGARRLSIVLVLVVGFALVEVVGGLLTNSLALWADAGHMATDAAGLLLALLAIRFAQRPATPERSFGYARVEILAAVANALEFGIDADPDSLERLCDDVLAVEGYAVRVPTIGSTVMSSIDRYTTQDILDAEESVRAQALERFDGSVVQHLRVLAELN